MKNDFIKKINSETSEENNLLFDEIASSDFRNFRLAVLVEKIKSQGYRPKPKMLYY